MGSEMCIRDSISSMYKDKDGKESSIFGLYSRWDGEEYTTLFRLLGYSLLVNEGWSAMKWNHVCLSYTNSTSNLRIVSNGEIILDEELEGLKQNNEKIPIQFLGNFAIMRSYFPELNSFSPLVGKMTDVNIWNISMTTQDMVSWTNCNNNDSGNIVNWEVDNWIVTGLDKEIVNDQILCQKDVVTMKVFVHKKNYQDSLDFCSRVGGNLTVADSSSKATEMMRIQMTGH